MDFFAVLPGQCLAVYQFTLKQASDECAGSCERVKDMYILIRKRTSKFFLNDITYGTDDEIYYW